MTRRDFLGTVIALSAISQQDKRPVVQIRASEALGSIGDPSALPALRKIVNDPKSDFATRYKLRNAIAQFEAAGHPASPKKKP
jgi:HEAT repeat protein